MGFDGAFLFLPVSWSNEQLLEAARGHKERLRLLVTDETRGPNVLAKHFKKYVAISAWSDEPGASWDELAAKLAKRAGGKALAACVADHACVGFYQVLVDGVAGETVTSEDNYDAAPVLGLAAAFGKKIPHEALSDLVTTLCLGAHRGVLLGRGARALTADEVEKTIEMCCGFLGDDEIESDDDVLADEDVEEIEDGEPAEELVRNIERLGELVDLAIANGSPKIALSEIERAIARDGENPFYIELRAHARLAAGDLDGAVADAERRIAEDPDAGVALGVRGEARVLRGDVKKGLTDLTRAAKIFPDYVGIKAHYVALAGGVAAAIAELDDVIEEEHDAGLYTARAIFRLGRGDWEGAKADLAEAVEDEFHAKGFAAVFLALLDEKHEGARTIAQAPGWPGVLVRFARGKTKREGLLSQVADTPRAKCELHASLGLIAELKGDLAVARTEYDLAIATDSRRETEYLLAKLRREALG